MKKNIQNYLIRFSGLLFLFREIIQRRYVTIIFLHNWSVETATMAFKYLSNNYNIISLNDFIGYKNRGKFKKLPPKSLIITIDDGYKENYDLLPLIKQYKIPITIFLTAGVINTNRHFWFDILHPKYLKEHLKKMSNQKRLELLKEVGFEQEKEYNTPITLNRTQISEMKQYVDFQCHTMFHPVLPSCNSEEAKREIIDSKELLEKEYRLSINAIAFPNGDFCERDLNFVKEAGYKCSLTTEPGFNTKTSNIFRLKRISAWDSLSKTELAVLVSGIRIFAFNFKTIFNTAKRRNNLKNNFS